MLFAETIGDQQFQRICKLVRLRTRRADINARPASGAKHQKTHDRIARYGHAIFRDLGLGVVALDTFDELGRCTGVKPLSLTIRNWRVVMPALPALVAALLQDPGC